MHYCLAMRKTLALMALALCAASPVWAGPWDVVPEPQAPAEIEPELRPHQKLELREAPSSRPRPVLPDPPASKALLNEGQISVSESSSLLAQFGIIEPDAAGFRPDVWLYLSADDAQRYVQQVAPSSFKPLNVRLGHVLKLRAAAPEGVSGQWFALRVQALTQLGQPYNASQMLAAMPAGLDGEMDWRARFELFAQQGNPVRACDEVALDARPADVSAEHWLRLALFCEAQQGAFAKIELAQSMAEEQGTPLPSWYVQLLEMVQYEGGDAPAAPADASPLDLLMIKAVEQQRKAQKEVAVTAKEEAFPKNPSYALLAIARHIRAGEIGQTAEWLQMLDRQSGASAPSFVVHELVRFLSSDPLQPRSEEANMLPSFTAIETVNPSDISLLRRYYGLLAHFDYDLPMATNAWLDEQPAEAWRSPAATSLIAARQAGNVAGYLFELNLWLQANPLQTLSNETAGERIEELLDLGEEGLARALAAEMVLLALQ